MAAAIAQGRGFADAYGVGQGATAHLLPVSPSIGGAVYAIFGINSWPAEFILATWSIGLALGTYLILYLSFARLGVPRWARLGALAFACIAPTYGGQEAVDFRVWEGGLAVFLTALFLNRVLAIDEEAGGLSTKTIAIMAMLTALLFFVNPTLGLGAYACAAIVCLRQLSGLRLIKAVGIASVALALFLAPWALRNDAALGEPILLRSNAGLELALANYPGALDPVDPREAFMARLRAIHPMQSQSAYSAMEDAGGEIAYARGLGREASKYIAEHPGGTALLALKHVGQIFVPGEWSFRVFGTGKFPELRAALASFAGILGLTGICLGLLSRRLWLYPALLLGLPALALCLFQPVLRYTYLFYPILVFSAGYFMASIVGRFAKAPMAGNER